MTWPPSQIYELCDRWKAGESVNQIARAMNLSRNAVVGKIYRMGMSDRGSPIKRYVGTGPTKEARRFPDLRPATCQYPLGELLEPSEWFCGQPTGNALKSYCDHHHSVCWVKPAKGADRPANVEWMLRHERVRA
jgi:GcrA cell cycle regulator